MLVICPKCNGPRTPRTDRPTEYRCVPCERIRKNSYLKTRQGKTALKRAQKRYRAKSARLRTVHRGQNRNLIEGVCALYLPPGAIVADVTYGKGNFWRNVDTSRFTLLASDIAPRDTQTRAFDCRCLPYCSNSIDVVVLDPPYVHNPGDHIVVPPKKRTRNSRFLWSVIEGSGDSVPRTPWDFSLWACSGVDRP